MKSSKVGVCFKRLAAVASVLFAAATGWATTYTWTGGAGDGLWSTAGNWDVGAGYPSTTGDTAVFPAKAVANVCFDQTVAFGTLNVTNKGMNVVFTAASDVTATVTTLHLGTSQSTVSGRTQVTFDGVTLTAKNAVYLNPGAYVKLDHGANVTAAGWNMYDASSYTVEARTELYNGSVLTSTGAMSISGTGMLVLDDSQVYCKGSFTIDSCVNGVAGWGRVFFSGHHPLLKVTGTDFCTGGKASYGAPGADFYFTIPEGGYEEAPIRHTGSGYFMRGTQSSQPQNSRLRVVNESPLVVSGAAFMQTLVSVNKAMTGTAAGEKSLVAGVAMADKPIGEIAKSDDAKAFVYTQHAATSIVTVASAPFAFTDVDYTAVRDLKPGDTHTFTAPEHPAISADVTCAGYVIYDVDTTTLKRTKVSEGSGTTCNYTHGTTRREIEWQWTVPEVTVDTDGAALQAAFAANACAIVKLAPGNYTLPSGGFVIQNAIKLVGTSSDPNDAKLKITTGASAFYALVVSNKLAKVSRVHVTNNNSGNSSSNGGIRLWAGEIDNCVVSNCNAATSSGTRLGNGGGGIRMEGGTVRNTTVSKCTRGRYSGGGITMLTSSCLVENCRVHNCQSGYTTAAPTYGGGINARAGTVRNTLVTGCSAEIGYGIYSGSATIENCTVVNGSTAIANTGHGIDCAGGVVRNCIVSGSSNLSRNACDLGVSGACVAENNNSFPQLEAIKNNIAVDPHLDASYALGEMSACVDSAKPLCWMNWMSDLAGNSRIQGKGPDMGCFERAVSTKLQCWIESITTLSGGTDTALVRLVAGTDGDVEGATYAWTVTDRAGNVLAMTNGTDCATADLSITNAANCTVRLTVNNGKEDPAEAESKDAFIVRASRVYVNIDGSGTEPYTTLETGTPSIYKALDMVVSGGEILVAPGTYPLDDRVYLQPGRTAVIRSLGGPDVTTFKMVFGTPFGTANQFPLFHLTAAGARLEGVTLVGPGQQSSRALSIENASAVVSNCVIRNFSGHERKVEGAGCYITAGLLTHSRISACTVSTGSSHDEKGAALWQTGGTVANCVIEKCTYVGLGVGHGGVVSQDRGVVRNCLIAKNTSQSLPVVCSSANAVLDNCTIVANTNTCATSEFTYTVNNVTYTKEVHRAGLMAEASSSIRNTLVAYNVTTVLGETNVAASASATIRNCFVSTKDFANGENCLFGNPKFKRAAKDAWHLRSSSAAINTGLYLDWMEGATDLDGNPRVRNKVPDIGCYEGEQRGFMIVIDGSAMGPNTDPDPIVTPEPVDPPPSVDDPVQDDPTQDDPSGPVQDDPTQDEPAQGDPEPEPVADDPLNPPANATVPTLAAVSGLSADEQGFYEEVVHRFDYVNPLDGQTGRRKYISFGFVTDEHSCKRIDGDNAATNPDKQYWYYFGSTLTQCDPSIRLLGAVSGQVGLDAVFNGGDFSTGNSLTSLTSAEYLANVQGVKAICNQYLPTTPVFTVDGNHDRAYAANATYGTDGHHWNDGEWRTALEAFNSDVSQNAEIDLTMHRDLAHPTVGTDTPGVYTGNCYHVDFKRLMPQGKPNVRFIFVSEYDSTPGNGTLLRQYDGFQFYDTTTQQLLDPTKAPSNTLIGVIAHGKLGNLSTAAGLYLNAGNRYGSSTQHASLNSNLGLHKGLGYIGSVAGHAHQTLVKDAYVSGVSTAACVQVNTCYSDLRKSLTRSSYCFSIFTVDTDRKKLIETRVVGGKVCNYESDIIWNAAAN